MAKLNWQKVHIQKSNTDHIFVDYSKQNTNQYKVDDVIAIWQNTSWPINGKYKNKPLKQLPIEYLEWVGMNFSINSKGYKLAVQELECRAYTAHKVSGPVR